MYDFDVHMRFVRSATDAWFNYATAAMAAYGAWQNHISNQLETEPESPPESLASPVEQAFSWWSNIFLPQAPKPAMPADFGAGFFQFSPMHSMNNGFNPAGMFNPFSAFAIPATKVPNPWAAGWMEMISAYSGALPQFSWSMMQGPMTAWLMAAGMPYSVAVPTARGNAASMDAAVAARESFDKMYSSFRTDGGHAVAPVLAMQPMAFLLAPYWTGSPKRLH